MADLINFTLPSIDEGTDEKTMKQIKNYLFQLTEQMKFYLNNIDSDNFTDAYNQRLSSMTTSQTTNSQKLSVTQQNLKKFKQQLRNDMEKAVSLISGNSGGYVILHDADGDTFPDEILIMNTSDIITATKMWRWNLSGLAYSDSGYDLDAFNTKVAITMDGAINANFITAGTLRGIRIEATIGEIGGFLITPTGMYFGKEVDGVVHRASMSIALEDFAAPFISVTVGDRKTFHVDYFGNVYAEETKIKNSLYVGWEFLEGKYEVKMTGSNISFLESEDEKFWVSSDYVWENKYFNGTLTYSYQPVTLSSLDSPGGLVLTLHDFYGPSAGHMTSYYALNGGQRAIDNGCRHEFTGTVKFHDELVADLVFDKEVSLRYKIGETNYRFLGFTNTNGTDGTQCLSFGIDDRTLKLWSSYLILSSRQITNSTTTALYINANGYLTTSSSSKRYKENISQNICDELNPVKLYDLPVKQFNYKEEYKDMEITDGLQIGFVAEDVAKIYPKAALYNKEGNVESWQERILLPAMLLLIQNLKKELDELKIIKGV